jgi:hypothetical protein
MEQPSRRWRRHPLFISLVSLLAGGAIVLGLLPAFADVTPGQTPKIAFVARDDNPFDSLSIGPVAAHFGGIVVITGTNPPLGQPAEDALLNFEPDLVVVAGGPAAISEGVFDELEQLALTYGFNITRIYGGPGTGRGETAEALAALLDTYQVGQPLVANPSGQLVVGDFRATALYEGETRVDLRGLFNVRGSDEPATQSDASFWTDLPAGSTEVTIPPGQVGFITVDFTAASVCHGGVTGDWCQLQFLLDGSALGLTPAAGSSFKFDTFDASVGPDGWKSLATKRISGVLTEGTHEVIAQFSVNDDDLTFELDDYLMFVQVHLV